VLDEHLAELDLPQGAKRRAGARQSPEEQLGQERLAYLCTIDSEGVKPSMSVEGAVDGKAFESYYIEHLLAPKLERRQIVVMDNLSVHKSKRVQRLIEEAGATLLFLPPYSPDMNPIEEGAFSKVKSAYSGKSRLGQEKLSWKRRVGPSRRSPPKTSAASIPIADTVCLCSRCENRSKRQSGE
jgi:transposase